MNQKRVQFLIEITFPDKKAADETIIQANSATDAIEWLNRLKGRFPGLQATLSPLGKKPKAQFPSSQFEYGNKQFMKQPSGLRAQPQPDGFEELTDRQRDIVSLLFKGHSYSEIGQELGISLPTVRAHLHSVYKRLGVKSRAQVVAKIFRLRA